MHNMYTSVQHSDMTHVNLMFSSLLSRKHWTAARTLGSSVAIRMLMAPGTMPGKLYTHRPRNWSQSFNLNCV